ncbi:SpoIIE family protein phosphatase [Victivallis sp.]|uniref:SpoIIE family protein phosphatase n=1 Tax=Victivallis sp. TaxID=2049020 RepID=UPI0025F5450E|nr:SpoIIE family protein phosphatase [uncultured Victivallis sp.]
MPNDVFVEMECFQLCHDGEIVCGDDFLFERLEQENRHLAVLSDGLGSGIKANLLACMTTTMALEFVRSNMDVLLSAEIIMDTLPVCEVRRISYATFSIFDLQIGGKSRIIEMDNPPFIHLRNGKDLKVSRQSMVSERWPDRRVQLAEIYAITGDRLIAFSDGVAQAGLGQPGCKFGWRREGALEFIQAEVAKDPAISARELSQRVVYAARNHNKDNRCIDDISCMVIYLRKPRRLRLLTGPPFRPESDTAYAELVRNFDGKIILSGGTTANIVSRELKRPIDVDMKLVMKAGNLPPPARMEGVDLVSEGILTLTDVVQRLEADPPLTTPVPLAAKQMIDLFRESDEIEFIVGTKVNEAHQDPSLPMDLEIRRNIVRRLKTVLENKYRKRVLMRYF